jgi:GST-like protein
VSLSVQDYANAVRWADQIFVRPAVARCRKVDRTSGTSSSQLHEPHDVGDFDTGTQDKVIGEQA